MRVTSTAFVDGADIPKRFTCDGENISPPVSWSGAPAETKSFALLVDDPDAPAGIWRHWAVYDLPAFCHGLEENAGAAMQNGTLKQAINDFHKAGYGGPCPPHGHGVHHYRFRLFALSENTLQLSVHPTCKEVEEATIKHAVAEVKLTGLYRR
jgi:Raf kinase inhibitor-like YbhB/YbcL family protein